MEIQWRYSQEVIRCIINNNDDTRMDGYTAFLASSLQIVNGYMVIFPGANKAGF